MSLSTNRSSTTQVQGYTGAYAISPVSLGTSWKQISIGDKFSLGLRSNNLLYGWGRNDAGQLGNKTVLSTNSPMLMGTTSWASVSAGASHGLGIRSDGLLFGWGYNASQQVGQSSSVPSFVGFWKQISVGQNHTMAIRTDGSLWAWGYNQNGQFGDGTTVSKSSPTLISTSSWIAIATAANANAAIDINGRLFAWGYNVSGALGQSDTIARSSPTQIGTATSWRSITGSADSSGGSDTFFALDNQNKLWGWGYNGYGQLGLSDAIAKSSPVQIVADKTWYKILSAVNFTIGIDANYALWTWGVNNYGQLADGTTINKSSPVQVGAGISFINIGSSRYATIALSTNGYLYTAGYNANGQLGDGTTTNRNTLIQFSNTNYGTSVGLPSGYSDNLYYVYNGNIYGAGLNSAGSLGDGTAITKSLFTQITTTGNYVNVIPVSINAAIFLRNDNAILATGLDSGYGALYPFYTETTANGYGVSASYSSPVQTAGSLNIINSPVQISTSSWSQVSAGVNHSMAIRSDKTLWAWGDNTFGQLMVTSGPLTTYSPTQVGSSSFTSVSAGNSFSLAITSDYKLVSGGVNNLGQLGLNTTLTPTYSWSQIDSGTGFTLAIRQDGTLWAWGVNTYGMLGTGDTITRSSPVQIGTSSWSSVSAGPLHSTAIKIDGTAWVWGYNDTGRMGDGTTINKSSPVQVLSGRSFIQVSAGSSTTYFLDSTNKIWTTGFNSATIYTMGDNTSAPRSSPVQLPSAVSFTQIAAGFDYGLALDSTGILWVWGYNTSGQLGTGDASTYRTLTRNNIANVSFVQINAGKLQSTSYAIDIYGYLWAWGSSVNYMALQGTTSSVSVPTVIGTRKYSKVVMSSSIASAFALGVDGALYAWGLKYPSFTSDFATATYVYSYTQIAAGGQTWRAMQHNYMQYGAGYNLFGALGDNTAVSKSAWTAITSDSNVSSIASGYQNSYQINRLGQLYAWGANSFGESGIGDVTPRSSPVQVFSSVNSWMMVSGGTNFATGIASDGSLYRWGTTNNGLGGPATLISWTQVSVAPSHMVLLRSDGAMYATGNNTYGQLGNGGVLPSSSGPGVIGGSNSWIAVAAGSDGAGQFYTLGIKSNGTIWGMGANTLGNLGDGTSISRSSPVQVGVAGSFTKVYAGVTAYAIKNDGTLWAWGRSLISSSAGVLNNAGMPNPMAASQYSSPVQVSSNSWTQLAVRANAVDYAQIVAGIDSQSRLYTWGMNDKGQLGTWTSPVFTSIAATYYNTYALDTNNNLWGWGLSSRYSKNLNIDISPQGQLTSASAPMFVNIPLSYKISSIYPICNYPTTGVGYTQGGLFMITTDGKLLTYGSAPIGNTADNTYQDNTSWVQISARGNGASALKSDGSIWTWGVDINGDNGSMYPGVSFASMQKISDPTNSFVTLGSTPNGVSAIDYLGRLWLWGDNTFGQHGDGTVAGTHKSSPTQVGVGYSWVMASIWNSGYYIRSDGLLFSSGNNASGQLGEGSATSRNSWTQIGADTWKFVTHGIMQVVAAIKTNGTLWMWGNNVYGPLGDGTTVNKSSPVQVTGGGNWSTVTIAGADAANSSASTYAIKADGTLWAWGAGFGSAGSSQGLPANQYQSVAVGQSHTALIDTLGRLYTFGFNGAGQLGDGTVTSRSSPVQVGSFSWASISSGPTHMVAVRATDGTIWSWGYNGFGQLGFGDTAYRSAPTQISGSSYVFVATGFAVSLAIDANGNLYSWGRNASGALGDGTTIDRSTPMQILSGSQWKEVYASGVNSANDTVVARRNDGTLWTWGSNAYGQLGDGTTVNKSSPIQLAASVTVSQVTVTSGATAYLDSLGKLYAVGYNVNGELGQGDTVYRSVAVQIGSSSYISIGSGGSQFFAIATNGAHWGWGLNTSGQIGDNTIVSKSSPVQIGSQLIGQYNPIKLFTNPAGNANGFIQGNPGVTGLFMKGLNTAGMLGDISAVTKSKPTTIGLTASQSSPVQIGTDKWLSVYASYGTGSQFLAAKNADGSIWMASLTGSLSYLGNEIFGRFNLTKITPSGNTYPYYSPGNGVMYLIDNNGKMYGAGDNSSFYRFPIGLTTQASFVQIGANSPTDVKQLFVGSSFTAVAASLHTSILKSDGTLWTWGDNTYGQLADNTVVSKSSPIQIAGSWASISSGASHTLGIKTDGTLWGWGGNVAGQLSQGDTVHRSSPVQITSIAGSWSIIKSGPDFAVGITTDNRLFFWGNGSSMGDGNGTAVYRSVAFQVGTSSWAQVTAQISNITAVTVAGAVFAWGTNTTGTLGDNTVVAKLTATALPSSVAGPKYVLHNNFYNSTTNAYIRNGDIYTWGYNGYGNVGDNTTANRSAPTQITNVVFYGSPVQVPGSWSSVSTGADHMAAIDKTGRLFAWGGGAYGQTGLFGGPDYLSISAQQNSNGTAPTNSQGNILYIRGDGAMYATGNNTYGHLGDGTTVSKSSPVQIGTVNNWKQVSVAASHTVALRSNGTIWGWGYNGNGQVGDNTVVNKSSPVQIGTGTSWSQVAVGLDCSFAVDNSGNLYAWGFNSFYQIGDGTTITKSSPVLVLSSVAKVFAGPYDRTIHAIKTDGSLWGWGANSYGELGVNDKSQRGTPVNVSPGTSWIMISSSGSPSGGVSDTKFGIKSDYTMWSVGSGPTGDANPARSTFAQIGTGGTLPGSYLAVYGGLQGGYALGIDNLVYYWNGIVPTNTALAWGGTLENQPTPKLMSTIRMRNLGNWERYRLQGAWPDEQNRLYVWGQNSTGLLGQGDTTDRSSPVILGAPSVFGATVSLISYNRSWISVGAGTSFTTAVDTTNKLFAWGVNAAGQLGQTDTVNRSSPVQLGATSLSWTAIGGGQGYIVAVKSNGTLWAWGQNDTGQLGLGDTSYRSSPVQVGALTGWIKVAKGNGSTTYAIYGAGTGNLYTWGNNAQGQMGDSTTVNKSSPVVLGLAVSWTMIGEAHGITATGTMYAWGNNAAGQVGDNTTANRSAPIQIGALTTWSIIPNTNHSSSRYAINTTGQLWGWGDNTVGQIGDNTIANRSSPVQIATGTSFTQVAAGGPTVMSTYAIATTGTLWVWGNNTYGQLGTNDTNPRSSPVQVAGSWTSVQANQGGVIATQTNYALFGWGRNDFGQLGDTTTINKSSPVQLSLPNTYLPPVRIANASLYSQYIFDNNNYVWAWGYNSTGQLGDSTVVNKSTPVNIITPAAYSYVLTSSGQNNGTGIKSNYLLDGWGLNSSYQLADTTTAARSSPIQVGGVSSSSTFVGTPTKYTSSSYTQVSNGQFHAIAIASNGLAYGWGQNAYGNLGNGSYEIWAGISGGNNNTAAYTTSNRAYMWGTNTYGQLGDNTTIGKSSPIQLGTGTGIWTKISAGLNHTLGLKTDGTLWAWGLNLSGQLGDGTTINKSSPIQIGSATNWYDISAHRVNSMAINTTRQLFVWGDNSYGQVGDNTTVSKSSPVQIGTSSWAILGTTGVGAEITTGFSDCLFAIDINYRAYGWGGNLYGQIGDATTIARSSPVQIDTTYSYTQVSSMLEGIIMLRTDYTAWLAGNYTNVVTTSKLTQLSTKTYKYVTAGTRQVYAIDFMNNLYAWGLGTTGELGDGTIVTKTVPTLIGQSAWVAVTAQGASARGIMRDFSLQAWGAVPTGNLTTPSSSSPVAVDANSTLLAQYTTTTSTPLQVGGNSSYSVVSAGYKHTMAIKPDGSLWGWGMNHDGQIGYTPTTASTSIYQLDNAAYITANNNLYMWGNGQYGPWGDNTVAYRSAPMQIGGSWIAVAAGGGGQTANRQKYSLLIDSSYVMWGSGYNTSAQLGTSAPGNISSLSVVAPLVIKKVTSGTNANFLIKNDGSGWGWGSDSLGQMGDSSTVTKSSPVQVPGLWADIVPGNGVVLGLKPNGTLWTWGSDTNGAQGVSTANAHRSAPGQIGARTDWWKLPDNFNTGWASMGAAITKLGQLYTWGANATGELGDNTTVAKSSPVLVIGTMSWVFVTGGGPGSATDRASLYGIDTLGKLWAWGDNSAFQLGDGTAVNKSSPVQIGTGTSWIAVAAGAASVWGLDSNNVLWAWGYNGQGQLGTGDSTTRTSPVNLGISAVAIKAGLHDVTVSTSGFMYYIGTDYKVKGIGINTYGVMGDGTTTNKTTSTPIYSTSSFTMVFAGYQLGGGLTKNNNLIEFGGNGYNLGDGTTVNKSSPIQLGSSGRSWVAVSTGSELFNTFGIQENATAWGWGINTQGTLGDGTTIARSAPVQLLGSWSMIKTNGVNTAGIRTDGTLWAWGNNDTGQLSQGDTIARSSPIQIGSFTATDVTIASIVGTTNAMIAFRKSDGTWWASGYGSDGGFGDNTTLSRSSPVQIASGKSFVKVVGIGGAASTATALSTKFNAIDNLGNLWGWGSNNNGGIGDNTTVNKSSPVQISVTSATGGSWTNLFANETATWGVYRANSIDYLYAWGTNWTGQLGTGDTVDRYSSPVQIAANVFNMPNIVSSPVQVGIGYSWSQVSAGSFTTMAIRQDGTLWVWGNGATGQMGQGDSIYRSSPTQVGAGTWSVIKNAGLWSEADTMFGAMNDGSLWGWGNNTYGQLGQANISTYTSPVSIGVLGISTTNVWYPMNLTATRGSSYTQVAVTDSAVVVTASNGLMYAWGIGTSGQLGITNAITTSSPVLVGNIAGQTYIAGVNQVGSSSWSQVSAGYSHSLGIKSDYSVWGWGSRMGTMAGFDTTTYSWKQVSITSSYQMAIRNDSTLWAVGNNANGQLGLNDSVDRSTYVQVPGSWSFIDVGQAVNHLAGIKTDGTLWVWGNNSGGQLGQNDTISRSSPVQIPGSWASVSVGNSHTLAIKTDKTLWVWGLNSSGQLGLGDATARSSPVQVPGSYTQVSTTESSSGWVDIIGNLYLTGMNTSGQLGDGTTVNKTSPVIRPSFVNGVVTKLYVANLQTYYIRSDGTLWGTGAGGSGSGLTLGDGAAVNRSAFVQIGSGIVWDSMMNSVTDAVASYASHYALDVNNNLYVWGRNNEGALGDGTTVSKSAPTLITPMSPVSKLLTRGGMYNGGYIDVFGQLIVTGSGRGYATTNVGYYATGTGDAVFRSSPVQVTAGVNIFSTSPTQLAAGSWVGVQAGNEYSSAINNNSGLFYLWGKNNYQQTKPGTFNWYTSSPYKLTAGVPSNAVSLGSTGGGIVYTPADVSAAPDAPVVVSAVATGGSSVNVTYTAPVVDGGKTITKYTAVSSPGGFTGSVNTSTSGTITVTGLTQNVTYTFTVYATNSVGNSASSNTSNQVTTWTTPGTPTIGTATPITGTIMDVTYTAPVFTGNATIVSYTAVSTPGNITGTVTQSGSGTIRVTGLTPNTAYTFKVYATNGLGDSGLSSATSSATTLTIPDSPVITSVTPLSTTSVQVAFTAPASNGGYTITSYTVTSTPDNITASVSQSGSGTITVTGLTSNTAYTFTITATNSSGSSPSSTPSPQSSTWAQSQLAFTTPGTYTWVVPANVYSISVVAVGGGGGGGTCVGGTGNYSLGGGGSGGALSYGNNIPVTPGQSLTVTVGAAGAGGAYGGNIGGTGGTSSIANGASIWVGAYGGGGGWGVFSGTTGGTGTVGCAGGGGAGGYAGDGGKGAQPNYGSVDSQAGGTPFGTYKSGGGNGGLGGGTCQIAGQNVIAPTAGSGGGGGGGTRAYGGGGVGILGQGADGAAGPGTAANGTASAYPNGGSGGAASTDGNGALYGGAGGGSYVGPGSNGQSGAVRIIWPGSTRTFPSTNTGNL